MAWRAAPRQLLIATGLQLAAGVGLAAQLLVGRQLLTELLNPGMRSTFSMVLPELVVLGSVSALASFANLARSEQQRLLTELVGCYGAGQVLEVACGGEFDGVSTPSGSTTRLSAFLDPP